MNRPNKICFHWTAGTYEVSELDRKCYHFIIDKDGTVHKGIHTPEDNVDCKDGNYAAHCGGGNTGCIGISFAGMAGFKNAKSVGKYPLTNKQVESGCKLAAVLVERYLIPLLPQSVFTHYDFGKAHPDSESYGKIDLIWLPFDNGRTASNKVLETLHKKINWYYDQLPK